MKPFKRAVTAYLAAAATPFCLDLLKKLGNEDWEALVRAKVSPSSYTNAHHYFLDVQGAAFFNKNQSLPVDIDRKAAAFQKWKSAEAQCARTNAFLSRVQNGPLDQTHATVQDFLGRVRKRVSWWLGPVPNILHGRFGPGTTLCCRRSIMATAADKMSVKPTTTLPLLELVRHLWEETAWGRAVAARSLRGEQVYTGGVLSYVGLVESAKWSSVDKTALTDRSIEIGPSLNVFYQLAVGKRLKESFARKGWDLRYAADRHRELAREASITGLRATIDLRSASDTVARLLVKACVPEEWFDLLDRLRTKRTETPEGTFYLEKFSGMGNGYTFELESVIFMAICQEVLHICGHGSLAGHDLSVFGDDIIVPTAFAQKCVSALELCGFEVNVDKTFIEGPFRESCGGDYFNGTAVRPHSLEKIPEEPQEWIAFANGLRRTAIDHLDGDFERSTSHYAAWIRVLDAIPNTVRECRGPVDHGDIVIHDDRERWSTRTKNSIRYIRTYSPVVSPKGLRKGGGLVEMDNFFDEVQLATVLAGYATTDRKGHVIGLTPRGAVTGYKHRWVPHS